jgi:hypothetical protein
MNMVGHEHVRMDCAPTLPRELADQIQVIQAIGIGMETVGPIVTALDDMERQAGELYASAAWHGVQTRTAVARQTEK